MNKLLRMNHVVVRTGIVCLLVMSLIFAALPTVMPLGKSEASSGALAQSDYDVIKAEDVDMSVVGTNLIVTLTTSQPWDNDWLWQSEDNIMFFFDTDQNPETGDTGWLNDRGISPDFDVTIKCEEDNSALTATLGRWDDAISYRSEYVAQVSVSHDSGEAILTVSIPLVRLGNPSQIAWFGRITNIENGGYGGLVRDYIPGDGYLLTGLADTAQPTVSANPGGGTYDSTQEVTLVSSRPAAIYFTTDGTTPTEDSSVYAEPIDIVANTTLKFFAVDMDGNESQIYTESYTINNANPIITATDPANNAINIAIDKEIAITFSEYIKQGSTYDRIEVRDADSNHVDIDKLISGKKLFIDPVNNLHNETIYTVTIPASAIEDLSGDDLESWYGFSFTTSAFPDSRSFVIDRCTKCHEQQRWEDKIGIGLTEDQWVAIIDQMQRHGARLTSTQVDLVATYLATTTALDQPQEVVVPETISDESTQSPPPDDNDQDQTPDITMSELTGGDKEDLAPEDNETLSILEDPEYMILAEMIFSDIPSTAWYRDYVSKLLSLDIIGGYPDGSFMPMRNITRAEFTKMLCLAMGWDLQDPSISSFGDVSTDSWAFRYIETAKAHEVIGGYLSGNFGPSKNITRAEISKILAKTLNLSPGSSMLTDTSTHWAKNFINSCVKASIMSGYPGGRFKPDNNATRAEAAKAIAGLLDHKLN